MRRFVPHTVPRVGRSYEHFRKVRDAAVPAMDVSVNVRGRRHSLEGASTLHSPGHAPPRAHTSSGYTSPARPNTGSRGAAKGPYRLRKAKSAEHDGFAGEQAGGGSFGRHHAPQASHDDGRAVRVHQQSGVGPRAHAGPTRPVAPKRGVSSLFLGAKEGCREG